MKELKSLSIFFPFLNDEKTVSTAIALAYSVGKELTKDLEVIAINGGNSKDKTFLEIKKQKKKHPDLIIIDKTNNKEGYAVIKYGFYKASKDWIFYTDGDLQYDIHELKKLVKNQQKTNADVINGYKIKRNDPWVRVFLGNIYQHFSNVMYKLPIKDLDCDFRLIKKEYLNKIELKSHDSSLLLELVKKLEKAGAKFTEVPIKHKKRIYGKSSYNVFKLLVEKIIGDLKVSAAGFEPATDRL